MSDTQSLVIVIHGESGVGKSWLGDTAPAPRLLLDAEHGTRFTPSEKVEWDPLREKPPEGAESVVVKVSNWGVLQTVFQWLNSGQHPFVSVVFDSLTEIQKRCMDNLVGTNAMELQNWGTLLREMEALVRWYRDLIEHPVKPLSCIAFLTMSEFDNGIWRPNLQGALKRTLPQFVDVVGYMRTVQLVDGTGRLGRELLTAPFPGYAAKDRTNKLPGQLADPDLEKMMEVIYAR